MKTLSAAQAKSMMIYVSAVMVESKEIMCEADRNIGDGDHGIGMAKGFGAALQELVNQEFDDVYKVFFTVGPHDDQRDGWGIRHHLWYVVLCRKQEC